MAYSWSMRREKGTVQRDGLTHDVGKRSDQPVADRPSRTPRPMVWCGILLDSPASWAACLQSLRHRIGRAKVETDDFSQPCCTSSNRHRGHRLNQGRRADRRRPAGTHVQHGCRRVAGVPVGGAAPSALQRHEKSRLRESSRLIRSIVPGNRAPIRARSLLSPPA